jgi:hypothetical protein
MSSFKQYSMEEQSNLTQMSRIVQTEFLPGETKYGRGNGKWSHSKPQYSRRKYIRPKKQQTGKERGLRLNRQIMENKLKTFKYNDEFFQWLKRLSVPIQLRKRVRSKLRGTSAQLKFNPLQIIIILSIIFPQPAVGLGDQPTQLGDLPTQVAVRNASVAVDNASAVVVPDTQAGTDTKLISSDDKSPDVLETSSDDIVSSLTELISCKKSPYVLETLNILIKKQEFDTASNKKSIQSRDQIVSGKTIEGLRNFTEKFASFITDKQGQVQIAQRNEMMYPVFRKYLVDYLSNIVYKNDQTFVTSLQTLIQTKRVTAKKVTETPFAETTKRFTTLMLSTKGIIEKAFITMGFTPAIQQNKTEEVYKEVRKNFESEGAVEKWARCVYDPSPMVQSLRTNMRAMISAQMEKKDWSNLSLYTTVILDVSLSHDNLDLTRNYSKALENTTLTPTNAAAIGIIESYKKGCKQWKTDWNVPEDIKTWCLGKTLDDDNGANIIADVVSVLKVVHSTFVEKMYVDSEQMAKIIAHELEKKAGGRGYWLNKSYEVMSEGGQKIFYWLFGLYAVQLLLRTYLEAPTVPTVVKQTSERMSDAPRKSRTRARTPDTGMRVRVPKRHVTEEIVRNEKCYHIGRNDLLWILEAEGGKYRRVSNHGRNDSHYVRGSETKKVSRTKNAREAGTIDVNGNYYN